MITSNMVVRTENEEFTKKLRDVRVGDRLYGTDKFVEVTDVKTETVHEFYYVHVSHIGYIPCSSDQLFELVGIVDKNGELTEDQGLVRVSEIYDLLRENDSLAIKWGNQVNPEYIDECDICSGSKEMTGINVNDSGHIYRAGDGNDIFIRDDIVYDGKNNTEMR